MGCQSERQRMKYGKKDNEIADRLRLGKTAAQVKQSTIPPNTDEFLNSPEWKKLRRAVLKKYGLECMKCGRMPKKRQHANVDHIRSRKTNPSLALDFDNLQVLCGSCNRRKGNAFANYRDAPKKEYEDLGLVALVREIGMG